MDEQIPRSPTVSHPVHFAIDASVIFQLGEHLISDAVQALVELIKNSYDADATQVLVEVDTAWRGMGPGEVERFGRIVVTDNGTGMTLQDLESGWLTLSNSAKRRFKRAGHRTSLGRTPLGEKGLGRLGAQRLGHDIEILTIAKGASREYRLAYSWDAFTEADSVGAVDLAIIERPSQDACGTWITIYGLKAAETWTEPAARARLEENLSQLVAPYAEVADFVVDVNVDQRALQLARVTANVLKAADLHYDIGYASGELRLEGRARLAFFQPPSGDKLNQFLSIVAADQGEALFAHLREALGGGQINLRRSAHEGWFVDFNTEAPLKDQSPRYFTPNPKAPLDSLVADPGPFTGAIDSFDLGETGASEQTAFDSKQVFRDYVKRFSGIRVYRDGFGIRVDRDWLKLSEAGTSGSSYYGLRPFNTLGFIAISARDNPELLEKTDREGFQLTPHYENFYKLLRKFVSFTVLAQGQLRRAYNSFAKDHLVAAADAASDVSPTTLTDRIRATLNAAEAHRRPVYVYSAAMRTAVETLTDRLNSAEALIAKRKSVDSAKALLEELRNQLLEVRDEVERAEPALRALDDYLASVSRLDPVGVLLARQVADLESRIGDLYEAASLGLTAEALSHEMAQITDQLQTRIGRVEKGFKAATKPSVGVLEFVQFVKASVAGLRHQLSHLAPSLRYARDSKEVMTMSRFLKELFAYHEERLKDTFITFAVDVAPHGDFEVEINRGKLTQVFDNLVFNSDYWLTRKPRRRGDAIITAQVDQPFVHLADSGPGIEPLYEASLFQAFVTGKPRGEGRGLGLFIIEQLLAMEGCTIALADDRNLAGRRFKFDVNFVGALHEPR